MTRTLALEPTPLATWHKLILEAEFAYGQTLPSDLESYLVFLLMHYNSKPELANSVLALEFINAIHQITTAPNIPFKEVGDKCLLFSGLFPERARRKRVNMSYFVKLGRSAYQTAAQNTKTQESELYFSLGEHFVLLMDILFSVRELDPSQQALTALDAEELWKETGSVFAKKKFEQHRGSVLLNLGNHRSH